MSCVINPVKEDQCVFLTYEGKLSAIEMMAARYEANAILAKRHWSRIVLDISRLKSQLNCQALLELTGGESLALPHEVQVALVGTPEQIRDANFSADPACAGAISLTIFSDAAQAMTWARTNHPADAAHRTAFIPPENVTNTENSQPEYANGNTANYDINSKHASLRVFLARPLGQNEERKTPESRL